ncbi:MAG: flippase [Anaerolineae bacterium]
MQHTLSRNTLILLLSNTGSAVLSFVLSVAIGRVLGKEGLGIYTTALAWVFPLSLAAEFGLGTLITREAARNPALERDYLQVAAQARLWFGGGLTVILILCAPLLSSDPLVVRGLQISAPLILINPLFGNFTAIFRARQQMWPIPWLNIGMLAAQIILTITIFLLDGDVLAALIVNTLTSAGQLCAAWWIWRRWFNPNTRNDKGENERHLQLIVTLKQAWPFAAAAILAAIQLRLAPIMLERMTDAGDVGYYAAATRFAEAGRTVPNALFGALFPALAVLAAQPASLNRQMQKILIGLGIFATLLGIVFWFLARPTLGFTYGPDFIDAAATLQLTMWGLLPGLLRAGLTLYWYAKGRETLTNKVLVLMLGLQLGFGLWLIPIWGALGAAAAVAITELAGMILLILPLRHQDNHENV